MKITILTLFPRMLEGFLNESIIGRAQKKGLVKIDIVDLRKWGIGKHKSVDDTPYGGGAGMVMKVDVVASALHDLISNFQFPISKQTSKTKTQRPKIILLTPQGKLFNQGIAKRLAKSKQNLILVCGHYEGFDERIRDLVDEEISIGDYILTGGELPAAVITDAIVRLISGVLGKDESLADESFENSLLEYPQYTRPEEFEDKKVPEILKSGNHAEIAKWRKAQALKRTKKRRSDLLC